MEKSRAIFFEYNDQEIHFDLGTFGLCMRLSEKDSLFYAANFTDWFCVG
jgi:hypothetical protein